LIADLSIHDNSNMTNMPSEAETVIAHIVPDSDGTFTVRIKDSDGILAARTKKDRRSVPIVVGLIVGILLILGGIGFAQRVYSHTPPRYMTAYVIDAAKVAGLPLSQDEIHAMNGWQNVPTYPPPAKGKDSDRIAADAALLAAWGVAQADDTTFAVGVGLAVMIAGISLVVSALYALAS
jgi:hypothetical protein